MARHQRYRRSRRGLSGIWSGVLVILILLLTSSFIFVALDYIDKATTTALNTVKRAGESCSITRSITGYWNYNDTTGEVTINITNYYLESITIVSLGFIINNSGTIQNIIIDKYNASTYGITLPQPVPPGGKKSITLTLPGKPITVSIGIWGSGLATLIIPPGKGIEAVGAINLPEAVGLGNRLSLELVENNTIYYTDMNTLPNGWIQKSGRWRLATDQGYWGTGDNALRARLNRRNPVAIYAWNTSLTSYNNFTFYTKIKFSRVDPGTVATVRLNGTYIYVLWFFPFPIPIRIIEPYFYNVNVTSENLTLELMYRYRGTWYYDYLAVPISIAQNQWYSLVVSLKQDNNNNIDEIRVQLYDSSTGSLLNSINAIADFSSISTSVIYHAVENASLIGWLDTGITRRPFNLYFDEVLVSTGNTSIITFTGTNPGWRVSVGYGGSIIGESVASGTSTNVDVVKDAVTAINGYSDVCVATGASTVCVTSDIPILGGNVYRIVVSGGVVSRNLVSISSSSR